MEDQTKINPAIEQPVGSEFEIKEGTPFLIGVAGYSSNYFIGNRL